MRVLVTGASGFLGQAVLTRLIAEGEFEVLATSRRPRAMPGCTWVEADLLIDGVPEALISDTRPTHLVHLAWNAQPGQFWTAPNNLDWSAATLRLASAFFRSQGQRLVAAGSCAEYDWTGLQGPIHERGRLVPSTLYGVCKDATRRALCAGAEQAHASCAWGRVFWLYGPGEAGGRLVSDVSRALVEGRAAPVGDGLARRDYLHVADAAEAFVRALKGSAAGPFNVGSGLSASVSDIVSTLADAAGRPDLIRWGAVTPRPGDPPVVEADIERLRTVIGCPPGRPLVQGLKDTLAWWRDTLERSA